MTLVPVYQLTWCNNPDDLIFYQHTCETRKYHKHILWWQICVPFVLIQPGKSVHCQMLNSKHLAILVCTRDSLPHSTYQLSSVLNIQSCTTLLIIETCLLLTAGDCQRLGHRHPQWEWWCLVRPWDHATLPETLN